MTIAIPELKIESDFEIEKQVDDYVFDLKSSSVLEDAIGLPVIRATMFTDALPYVVVIQIDDEFADSRLCEDMRAFIAQSE